MAKEFMGKDFLLNNEPAIKMFEAADKMPIFDWHCHLSPKEIYENAQPADIAWLWLAGDHYKWRAMRSCGVDEKYITGDATGYEKFKAFAGIMPNLIGNPMYHWCHLELRRYFGINDILCAKTADDIWNRANAAIKAGGFTPRELIEKSNVSHLCTTDDPADSLEYHVLLAKESDFKCKVLPAFRPDKALGIDLPAWRDWLKAMEKCVGRSIDGFEALCDALNERIEFFASLGCCASDHAFAYVPYEKATAEELDCIFAKVKNGGEASVVEADKFKTALLAFLAEKYSDKGWVMELHIGPMRNNNTLMFNRIGPDAGFDSIDDREIAGKLSRFLDSLAVKEKLPKTVLFTLNPKDNYVLGAMLGNFQNSDAESKIQFGSAWWFNDNIDGMREQMKALGNLGALGKFVGMVTDSRSFLSYPRHEYFRRIMCGLLGDMVENGLYPFDEKAVCKIAEDISYNNAAKYFGI
ncbi:MAG: glucuronate isomerase [Clostridia bacterium]|nr:glucuronate isomerase [Clostridia bacterium]MBP3696077.1 glucuronate isomerase [Clostridia bacterium]